MPKPKRYSNLDSTAASLRRSFQAALHCKPTKLEENAIVMAAQLASRAEAAAADPNVSPEAVAKISDSAARARSDLARIIEARHRAVLATPKTHAAVARTSS
jgi:hypothetical protein